MFPDRSKILPVSIRKLRLYRSQHNYVDDPYRNHVSRRQGAVAITKASRMCLQR